MTNDNIRAAWCRFHGPIPELDGYIPATPPTYSRGYEDGYAAREAESHAPVVVETLKLQITLLRMELRDALSIGYGASISWPASARELLEMDT
jgi:hypothetical protein